jgi:hypothetical protein
VRTTGDTWLAGKFAGDSYAAGYPNDPDLLLEEAYEIDQESGILGRGLGYPLYIASGQIAWVEVVWPSDDDRNDVRNGQSEQAGPTDDAPVDASK